MKKFKTKRQRKLERKNILLIGFCILFIIIFIYLSTRKLEKDYNGFINYVLEEQGFVEKENSSFFSVYTSNLEVLLSNYYFKDAESEKLVYQDNAPLVYIYATHDEEEYKNDGETNVYKYRSIPYLNYVSKYTATVEECENI